MTEDIEDWADAHNEGISARETADAAWAKQRKNLFNVKPTPEWHYVNDRLEHAPERTEDPWEQSEDPQDPGPGDSWPEPPSPPLPFINMSNWENKPRPERKWSVLDRYPLRQTVLFSGEGSVGKSIVQLMLSAAHVLGRDWLGTMPEPGSAIYIDAEDDEDELHIRLADILNHYKVSFADAIRGGLHLMSFAGRDAVIATGGKGGKIEPTPLYQQLFEAAGDIKPKMIGLASSANFYAGSEIDRSQVQQFIGLLTRLAIIANGTVVLISHPSLTGINTDTGLSGSTQWHNSVRARAFMKSVKTEEGQQPNTDLREISFKKNNYGPVSARMVLRYQNGLFLPVPGVSSLDQAARDQKADDIFLTLLCRFNSQKRAVGEKPSANYAPALFAKEEEAKSALMDNATLADAMRRLFKENRIHIEHYGRRDRQSYRLAIGPTPDPDSATPAEEAQTTENLK
jgi:RecA-family ATPase